MTSDHFVVPDGPISPSELASIGGGRLAYVKTMTSDELHEAFPLAPALQPGLKLFALLAADGTPILVTDTREAALANAWENELLTVSLH
ncbi:hypothetical protein GCM10007276_07310 [Agaricicola taiwanensis]|uniref:DUF1150 domain-containing protein n=1 Tax=Agaricicola taiwanensis TaxID=591372 RepID=A0A8J2YD32_9RHOB|nr:DUF1150 domain-containing protein [Agaricicola taiwanensis]GGE32564.1 hypothetical protein GCM10007276_07310 [Agaricicola taiwanensis]